MTSTDEHVIVASMIDEWNEATMNVCRCSCGKVFRVPRNGGGLAGALKRHDEMGVLIAAHYAEVLRRKSSASLGGLER